MSRRRCYSPETQATIARFFQAHEAVIANGLIKNRNQYCKRYGIDPRNLHAQRADPGRGYFEVGWLYPLIADFGVSSHWLLTGKGAMFVQ